MKDNPEQQAPPKNEEEVPHLLLQFQQRAMNQRTQALNGLTDFCKNEETIFKQGIQKQWTKANQQAYQNAENLLVNLIETLEIQLKDVSHSMTISMESWKSFFKRVDERTVGATFIKGVNQLQQNTQKQAELQEVLPRLLTDRIEEGYRPLRASLWLLARALPLSWLLTASFTMFLVITQNPDKTLVNTNQKLVNQNQQLLNDNLHMMKVMMDMDRYLEKTLLPQLNSKRKSEIKEVWNKPVNPLLKPSMTLK